MQAMPEIKTPRIHPPIALFNDAPKNNPITAHKIIIITDTTVLNFFIQSHSFVKLELAYFLSGKKVIIAPTIPTMPKIKDHLKLKSKNGAFPKPSIKRMLTKISAITCSCFFIHSHSFVKFKFFEFLALSGS